jgi:Alpha/beta hydrolase domain
VPAKHRLLLALPTVALAVIPVLLASSASAGPAAVADTATPDASLTVSGPVTGGKGAPTLAATTFDPTSLGYVESEYFASGTANAYTSASPLTADGKWRAEPAATAPYETRIVVFRPQDATKFNGTVVVEWLNVSAGSDAAPDWINAHNALIRGGYAWVGVSAQAAGLRAVKAADPQRYAPLNHPGDSFSYDIYSQVGRLVRRPGAVDPLGGLKARRVIAAGESQSAFRMVTYVNAIQPLEHVYDGFLIHSRSGSAAPLSQAPQASIPASNPTFVRDDVDVPVLTFQTETDLEGLRYISATQADAKHFRLWEVAGTAHADAYLLVGSGDTGDGRVETTLVTKPPTNGLNCATAVNSGPQFAVLSAAIVQLDHWVRTGTPPPKAPRIRTTGATIVRDARGNAVGGIRTPFVDAPTAALSGSGQGGAGFCFLFGTTRPFDAATLSSLYPSHDAYVKRFRQSAARAVRAGFLLAPEAHRLVAAAQESPVG